ncbi:MAG: energy-coupling factor transporter transmembrane component T family protein [Fusobacteriaceae bacterium]
MSRTGMLYIDRESPIHRLDGSVKLLMMLLWIGGVFLFNDFRIFLGFFIFGIGLLKIAKIKIKEIKPLFVFILLFTFMNSFFLMLITPQYGNLLTGTKKVIMTILGRTITLETLWFAITLSMKYIAIFPIMSLFIFTTHPTRFASSLNKIGVQYKVAYAINIALRYIPDLRDEFIIIMKAQEARGIAFKKGDANLITRLKNYKNIVVPLVISSLNRIDTVTNAMNLRGFGIEKNRTWYGEKKYDKIDFLFLLSSITLFIVAIIIKQKFFKNFWYPF